MELSARTDKAGLIGMTGSAIWFLSLILEYALGLQPPAGEGPLYVANQLLAFLGLAGVAYGWLGILWGKGVRGRFGKVAVWMFTLGYTLIILAGIIALFTHSDNNPIFILLPLGGLLIDLGALLTGILVVTAKQWSGWPRFMPLIYALILWLVIEIPFILDIYPDGPGFVPETVQAIGLFFVGLAVFRTSD